MNPIEEEFTNDLSGIYHLGGLSAVYEAGRADAIADHELDEVAEVKESPKLYTFTISRSPRTAAAKSSAGYQALKSEIEAETGPDAIKEAIRICEWKDPVENFNWKVTNVSPVGADK